MRGPIAGVPALLQPVAHALLQIGEDIARYTAELRDDELWMRPDGLASVAFHIQHIQGVTDRMLTYAEDRALTAEQLAYLKAEGTQQEGASKAQLLHSFSEALRTSLARLSAMPTAQLAETRYLGRQRVPTTLIGLLVHAAEHGQRHLGQLLVTARWVIAARATG